MESILGEGDVEVVNCSHEEPEEHTYTIHVEGGIPSDCTCPAFEYQEPPCKHMVAVAIREPVLEAATAQPTLKADGGVTVEAVESDHSNELPDATWVPEEDWGNHGFNEHSIVRLEPSPDGEMTLFINEDAAPLVNFRKRNNLKESGKKYVKQTYKLGVILYSVGQYMEIERKYGEDPHWEEIDPAEVIETSMKGVAQSLLDQTITDDKLDEITY